jgi:DNA gyrase/topoisomerase IV subunit B
MSGGFIKIGQECQPMYFDFNTQQTTQKANCASIISNNILTGGAPTTKKIENTSDTKQYSSMTDKKHIWEKTNMYIGSPIPEYLKLIGLSESGKLIAYNTTGQEFLISQGLCDIITEGVVNAEDNYPRSSAMDFEFPSLPNGQPDPNAVVPLNKEWLEKYIDDNSQNDYFINMSIDGYGIWTIENGGKSIPIDALFEDSGKLIAEAIFSNAKTGSNYGALKFSNLAGGGTYGFGIKIANFLSKFFILEIGNEKEHKKITITWKKGGFEQTEQTEQELIQELGIKPRLVHDSDCIYSGPKPELFDRKDMPPSKYKIEDYVNGKNYVKIKFCPNYEFFGLKCLPNNGVYESLFRLKLFMAATYLYKAKVTFNTKPVIFKNLFKDQSSLFNNVFSILHTIPGVRYKPQSLVENPLGVNLVGNRDKTKNVVLRCDIRLFPTDTTPVQIFLVNGVVNINVPGVTTVCGSTIMASFIAAVNNVMNKVDEALIEPFRKQFKIKNTEAIKSRKDLSESQIKLFDMMKDLVKDNIKSRYNIFVYLFLANPTFVGQTKGDIQNTLSFVVNSTEIKKLIADNKEMYIQMFEKKVNEKQFEEQLNKEVKKRKFAGDPNVEGFIPANYAQYVNNPYATIQQREMSKELTLLVVEGNSAGSLLESNIDPNVEAVFKLKGKLQNSLDKKIKLDDEGGKLLQLSKILGFGLPQRMKGPIDRSKLVYKKIVIVTDQDPDGMHIMSLILTYFWDYYPDLLIRKSDQKGNVLQESVLYGFVSPLYILTKQRIKVPGKEKLEFYSNQHFSTWRKNMIKTMGEKEGHEFTRDGGVYAHRYEKGIGGFPKEDIIYILSQIRAGQNLLNIYYETNYPDPLYANIMDKESILLGFAKKVGKEEEGDGTYSYVIQNSSKKPADLRKNLLNFILSKEIVVDTLEDYLLYISEKGQYKVDDIKSFKNFAKDVKLEDLFKSDPVFDVDIEGGNIEDVSSDIEDGFADYNGISSGVNSLGTSSVLNSLDFGEAPEEIKKHKKAKPTREEIKKNESMYKDATVAIGNKKISVKQLYDLADYDYGLILKGKLRISKLIMMFMYIYSTYNINRNIPMIADGLKPGQRKILYTAKENSIRGQKSMKVDNFAAEVQTKTDYHHGAASMEGTIVGLAQNFCGSNNIAILEPLSGFGSFFDPTAAATRYIKTRLSPVTDALFRKEEDAILPYLNGNISYTELFDTFKFTNPIQYMPENIEPVFYMPTLPLVLINGTSGIGTGHSTKICPFHPKHILDNVRRLIRGEKLAVMHPYYNMFKGKMCFYADTKTGLFKYIMIPNVSLKHEGSKTFYLISSLPPDCWTKQVIQKIKADVQLDLPPIEVLGIKNIERAKDDDTAFVLEVRPGEEIQISPGVKRKFSINDFVLSYCTYHVPFTPALLDRDAKIRMYRSPLEILEDFYQMRIEEYERRKKYNILDLVFKRDVAKNKYKFAILNQNTEPPLSKMKDDKDHTNLINILSKTPIQFKLGDKTLTETGITPMSDIPRPESAQREPFVANKPTDNYSYVIKEGWLSLYSSEIDVFEKEYLKLDKQIAELEKISIKDMYLKDLDEFEKVFNEQTENRLMNEVYSMLKSNPYVKYIQYESKDIMMKTLKEQSILG